MTGALATDSEHDSLVKIGGMVEDHEDIKPEFVDIVKVPTQAADDCKPTSSMVSISLPVVSTLTEYRVF